ncbi:MAG TPA: SMI1/KNR4 family protein [Chitinophagaceae bacterium]|nr:SMI1/KNR4 family protein [Chitinophagaceae bacterium]
MDKYWNATKDKIENYERLGVKILEDSTKLIAKAPHIAPYAWLHSIYKPLNADEILHLEKELSTEIPDDYKHFLSKCSNGLNIFIDAFSLYGFRKRQGRTIEDSYQPYSIITRNRTERLRDADSDMFFIGSYSWDGSLLYIQKGKVYRCTRKFTKPLNEWLSFEEMLVNEIDRIFLLHDKEGKIINEDIPTSPQ